MFSRAACARSGAALVLVISSALSNDVSAQTATPAPAGQSAPKDPRTEEEPLRIEDRVEVTATRGSIDTDMSPASSAVVLRDELERRDVTSVDQALTPVEGVYAYRQRGLADNEAGVGMRGFSGRGGGQSRVLILLDGQPLNNSYTGAVNWTAVPLGEVDRVEVVRGPFSSLYGGNAMGGVVNILTRPIERRSAELYTQVGTHNTWTYSLRGGTRLFERLGVGFSYEGQRTGGYPAQEVLRPATDSTAAGGIPVAGPARYLTRTGTVNYGVGLRGDNHYERYGLRARTEYTFGPQTFGSFQFVRQANDYGWGPYTTWIRTADGQSLDSGAVVFQDEGVGKRLTVAPSNYLGVVGGGSSNLYQTQLLRSTTSRGQWRFQGGVLDAPLDRSSSPGTTATLDGGPGTFTGQSNRGVFVNGQWSTALGSTHGITVGSDLRHDQAAITVFPTTDYLAIGSASPRDTFSSGKAVTTAAYAQDQVAFSDNLQLTLGARLDYWRTYGGESQPAANLGTVPFDSRADRGLTGKVALVYRVAPGSVLRTSVGTSFRSPSVFDLYRDLRLSSGQLLLGNPALEPERLTSWEGGLRQDLGGAVSIEAAYYENRVRDLIQRSIDLIADPTGLTSRHVNAGQARTRGVELGVTLRPSPWLTAKPTYTFTDAEIVRNDAAPATVGKQPTFVPRHVAAGTITAIVPRLTVTGTGRYESAVFALDTNTDTTKGVPGSYDEFFEVDLAANLELTGRLTVHVAAENLFDRRHYLFYRNPGRLVMGGLRLRY